MYVESMCLSTTYTCTVPVLYNNTEHELIKYATYDALGWVQDHFP